MAGLICNRGFLIHLAVILVLGFARACAQSEHDAKRKLGPDSVGTHEAEVISVGGLRQALTKHNVKRIYLLSSLWLDSEAWPFEVGVNPPVNVNRSILITSPESYGTNWTSLQMNYLSGRVRLAPGVDLTFSRVFVHGLRKEVISVFPGFNLFASGEPVPPSQWPRVIMDGAALVFVRCAPKEFLASDAFSIGTAKSRADAGISGKQVVLPYSDSSPMPCALSLGIDDPLQCWPTSNVAVLMDTVTSAVAMNLATSHGSQRITASCPETHSLCLM